MTILDSIKKIHKSKQPINLDLVNVDQIVVSDKFKHNNDGFEYLMVTKKAKLLKRYVLSYLKWLDTQNILKTEQKACLS